MADVLRHCLPAHRVREHEQLRRTWVDPYSGAKPTGGTWMVHLESVAINAVPPERGEWTKQIAIDIGSGRAGLTVTTDSPLNTTLLDPAGNTERFTVA